MIQFNRDALVLIVGGAGHEDWRQSYRAVNGDKPRIKTTKDAEWIAAHGTDQVDIAALTYAELPLDWQGENKVNGEVAVDEMLRACREGQELDDAFVEAAAGVVHAKWLERNREWAPAEQNLPYSDLSESEKEKDRVIIRRAMEAFNRSCR